MVFSSSSSFLGTSVFSTQSLKTKRAKNSNQLPRKTTISAYTTATTTYSSSTSSMYEVLGIPATASGCEIKKAYRKLARVCHPDVVAVNQKDSSAALFMKIHAAYLTLSDPDKRANYDRDLIFMAARANFTSSTAMNSRSSTRFSGYGGRNWETDQCW